MAGHRPPRIMTEPKIVAAVDQYRKSHRQYRRSGNSARGKRLNLESRVDDAVFGAQNLCHDQGDGWVDVLPKHFPPLAELAAIIEKMHVICSQEEDQVVARYLRSVPRDLEGAVGTWDAAALEAMMARVSQAYRDEIQRTIDLPRRAKDKARREVERVKANAEAALLYLASAPMSAAVRDELAVLAAMALRAV